MKHNKFHTIFEAAMSRYQRAGFLVGDVVTFQKGFKSNEDYKRLTEPVKEHLADMIATGLNIRVTNITNAVPSTQNPDPAASTGEVFLSIACDEGGGRFSHQVVVPSTFFDVTDLEGNLPPIPDVWKYKANVNIKPEELEKGDKEHSLANKNTKIPSKAVNSTPAAGGMHDYLKELKKA